MSLSLEKYESEYRSKQDIVNAIAWSSIKKYLDSAGIGDIFMHIKSIQVDISKKVMTLKTGKSIYNSELLLRQESILESCNSSLKIWGINIQELRIR